jgi:hypothetical protein
MVDAKARAETRWKVPEYFAVSPFELEIKYGSVVPQEISIAGFRPVYRWTDGDAW